MENNVAQVAKKVWSMVRVVFFMLRKGLSKAKLMMHLNIILKRRRKLAGKAIANLMMFHHHHSHDHRDSHFDFSAPREYEFSCSNTPNYLGMKRRHSHLFACVHAPATRDDEANAVKAVLEILNKEVEASPALNNGNMVRQLRVTDSPFPLHSDDDHSDENHVDKAAEDFIKRFYKDLSNQNYY